MPLYPLGVGRSRDVPRAAGLPMVHWTRDGELACAWIGAPHGDFAPLEHAAALEAIDRRLCVLPMRFGAAVDDEAELRSMLQCRRDEWLDRLGRVDGACEMGVRITLPISPPPSADASSAASSPSTYLEQRRSHYRNADAANSLADQTVQDVVGRLQADCRDWRRLPSSSPGVVRLAFLVDRGRAEAFRRRVERSQDNCAVVGPWPPYSFVG